MNTITDIIIEHLEKYRALLEEQHRLLNCLESDPDDEAAFRLLEDVCFSIERNGIRPAIPEDLNDAASLLELIEILQNHEADCLTDSIQLCRVKKLRRHFC